MNSSMRRSLDATTGISRSSVQKCLLLFSVLAPEERREIICTEDRKDHEEEKAGRLELPLQKCSGSSGSDGF
jgi:hypothetical protein